MPKRFLLLLINVLLFASLNAQTTAAEEMYNDGKKLSDEVKYKEAIEKYKAAVTQKTDYVDALYETGWCYNELQDYKNAIIFLDKAKRYDPEIAKIYFQLGYAYYKTNNVDAAKNNYKKTLEIAPTYYSAARYLADIYYSEHDYENALPYFKNYVDNTEDVANVYYYKTGWCLNDLKKYEEAATYLEKYEPEENEDKAEKWAEIGFAHYKSNEYEIALLDYSNALDAVPGYGLAIRGIADCYFEKDDYDNALKYYQQAINEDEENSKIAYYRIGWIYNDKENFAEAITALQKAIEYNETDAGNREELGYAYCMTDKYDDAITQLNKAIELDENSKLGYYYKGLCYVALNDKTSAKEVYDKLKIINEEQAEKLLKKINGE